MHGTFCRFCFGAMLLVGLGPSAWAGFGPYEHGYGIKSLGAGGVAYALHDEAYQVNANPAAAALMGHRLDLGLNWNVVDPGGSITGNAAGADQQFDSDVQRHYPIPQAAWVRPLNPQLSTGVTFFAAGLGTEYRDNPYARFGGEGRGKLGIMQVGLSGLLAWRVAPRQSLGLGLNVSYRSFELKGIQPFAGFSQAPAQLTNQGEAGGLGVSVSLGWQGQIAPGLQAGIAVRTPTYMQKLKDYAGALPHQGQLNLPAIWGGGLAYELFSSLTVAVDAQRLQFGRVAALGNPIAQLQQGHLLGSDEGPGFGWRSQTIYKLGLIWQASPQLTLRAGYNHGSSVISPSETLFDLLAPSAGRRHYTLGGSYAFSQAWEASGYASWQPREHVSGRGSIPADFGGGEADVFFGSYAVGVSLGRRFGN